MGRLSTWAARAEDSLPDQPPPAMKLHLGPTVPAWIVRLAATVLAMIAGLLVTDSLVGSVLMLLACLTVLFWPGTGLPVAVAALIGWGVIAGTPTALEASIVVGAVHAFLVLSRLIGGVGWGAVVERRALGRVARPFMVLQVVAQAFVHLALILPQGGAWLTWLAIAALGALVGLTAAIVLALRRMT